MASKKAYRFRITCPKSMALRLISVCAERKLKYTVNCPFPKIPNSVRDITVEALPYQFYHAVLHSETVS